MNDVTPRLSVRLLGTPEVLLDGAPLVLNHVKARALLYFLAASGERHGRDYLASLLWSEAGTSEAHHSLRSAVYRLRQAIEGDPPESLLVSDAETLFLEPSGFRCDAVDFRRLLAQAGEVSLSQAAALVRGAFLQGFSVPNADAFEEWRRSQDTYFRLAGLESLEKLSKSAEAREDGTAALAYLQQMVQLEPLAENAQQRLMRLYLRQGEVSSALRQYRRFEALLRQELDLEPAADTQAVLRNVLRQQRSYARPVSATSAPARRPAPLPFVGRDDVLRQLEEAAAAVQAGLGATVLIEGEGGIGKSRLLDEISSRLIGASVPWMVLQGACTPFDDLRSQGPFLEALDQAMAGDFSELAARAQGGVPDARGQFPWHVLQTIRTLCKNAPLLLIIEDLQWANSSTLNLFGFLAMRLHHLPVLLMGTVQQPEAIPALQRLIALQRHRGELSLVHLAPLNGVDVNDVLRVSGIDASSVDSLGEWLVARSAGNPFLLTEILAQMRAEGILRSHGPRWELETTRWLQWRAAFVLPETTHDLVAWRLANLDADARRVLDVLAVAGQPISEAVLREFTDVPAGTLPDTVDDLAGRGLLMETSGHLLALPHHLLRETLLHRLSSVRRRSIYRQLATALENSPGPRSRLTGAADDVRAHGRLRQIALYAVAGEDVDRARRYGLPILSELPQEYSGAESIDFVQHLHDLLGPAASPAEMVRLTRALGLLQQSVGHLELAARSHVQSLQWAGQTGDRAAQAQAYFEMAELALVSNDYRAALDTARQGLSRLSVRDADEAGASDAGSLVARGHRLLGAAFAMEGSDLAAAERELQEALVVNREIGNQGDLCATLFELGNIAAQRGELQRAIDLYRQSAQAAEAGRIHYYLALAHNNLAYHSLLLGEIAEARQAAAQGIKVAEAYDLLAALLHLYSTQGEIQLYLAEWGGAQESFQRGLLIAEELGSLERQAGYRGGLALAARGLGDLETAVTLLREALALIADQGYWHLRTRLQIWLAETLRQRKLPQEAMQLVEEAVSVSQAHQRIVLRIQGECIRATLLAEAGDWAAAAAVFNDSREAALALDLPLEVARVQAAWGQAALECSPIPNEGRRLIDAARAAFVLYGALADLAGLA
jgi:DNA-binding SARP family transcriptional activator/predicted ATPase